MISSTATSRALGGSKYEKALTLTLTLTLTPTLTLILTLTLTLTGQPPTRNSRTVLSVLGPPSTTTSTIGTE